MANQYFLCAVNRVGMEKPWNIGEFYGSSYICDPRGQMVAVASRDKDEVLVETVDLDLIQEVRNVWQFYRDRRRRPTGRLRIFKRSITDPPERAFTFGGFFLPDTGLRNLPCSCR